MPISTIRHAKRDFPGQAEPARAAAGVYAHMSAADAADYDALIERALALVPLLRAAAPEAERLRRLTEPVVAALQESGLYRIMQPRQVGGYALPPMIFHDVCSILARGCASAAWVVANLAAHHQMLALWPAEGQSRVWGETGDGQIAASYVFPAGRATRVEGGYRLSGRWPFSSGVYQSEWNMLGGMVQAEGREPERRLFLLHRDQYEVLDTWYVSGLKATGSADLTATDVFVPECLTLAEREMLDFTAPGLAVHREPLFRFPTTAAAPYILVAVLQGAARGAYDDFVASIRNRIAHTTGKQVADFTAIQAKLAEAGACLDAADVVARCDLEGLMQHLAATEQPIAPAFAAKLRRNASFCTQLCVRATDVLFAAAGGTALYEKNHLERAWRDVHAGSAQIVLQWDIVGPAAGRVELGLPSGLAGI